MINATLISSSSASRKAPKFEHVSEHLKQVLHSVKVLLFISYARPGGITLQAYTDMIRAALSDLKLDLDLQVIGIESYANPLDGVQQAGAIFVGGGNTFLLLKTLQDYGLMDPIRERIEAGIPYIGASAGANLAGLTVNTSNDMPIVLPLSLKGLGLLPFNINPHYPSPNSEDPAHNGEQRAERIKEFHEIPENKQPVIALREHVALIYKGGSCKLVGTQVQEGPDAYIFRQGKEKVAWNIGSELGEI